jgi:hypothetical protein
VSGVDVNPVVRLLIVMQTYILFSILVAEGPLVRSTIPYYRSIIFEFDSRRYQIFREVVGLERGPLSPVRIIARLLEKK